MLGRGWKSRIKVPSIRRTSSPVLRYAVAVLVFALALLLKLLLDPLAGEDAPFVLFFTAVMVSAWYGGLGPGLLVTALSTVAVDLFFLSLADFSFLPRVRQRCR
ncbi:MAG: DUF4118 domain-containing protein [Actinomycetota bacterium]|nr:DUF4118 domain-containing protein [Actinomycetota bacterium]